jgi:hypothetical protein
MSTTATTPDTTTTVPSVEEIARDLVKLCQAGQWEEPVRKYYADEIVSVEPMGEDRVAIGLAAVKAKGQWWFDNHIVHEALAEGPYVGGNKFVVRFTVDVTFKPTGKRNKLDEVGVYTVENGKIVREQFLFSAA